MISRRQAVDGGATRAFIERRVASGRWLTLFPRVYRMAGAPRSWRQQVMAACLACGDAAAASHRCAGALVALPGLEKGTAEISVPRRRHIERRGIVVHRVAELGRADVTRIDGIPSTTATRTLIDLAGILARHDLEEVLDDALRRRITSVSRLRSRIDALSRRGRPGIGVIDALVRARAGVGAVPESVLETRLTQLLRKAGLPRPVAQYPVRDGGRVIARVDLGYPERRLAIEADGYRWHSSRVSWDRDIERRNRLTATGWRVVHVTWSDVEDRPGEVVERVRRALTL